MTLGGALRHTLHFALALALGLVLLFRGLQWYADSLDASQPQAGRTPTPAPAASSPPPRRVLPVRPDAPAPSLIDFSPKRIKGAWADAPWRRPHQFCRGRQDLLSPTTLDDFPPRPHWMETCGYVPPRLEITIAGTGFSEPPDQNSVFFGGVRADVVSGDRDHLVVRPMGGPPLAPIVVRASGAPRDEADARDRATFPLPLRFIGPPRQLVVVEGDHQERPTGSTLSRIVIRLVDSAGEGVPGERVWFSLRRRTATLPIPPPVRFDGVTDDLGLATLVVTAPDQPGQVMIQAEAVNTSEDPRDEPRATITATAVPKDSDLDALLRQLSSPDALEQHKAARALSEMGEFAKGVAPSLVRLAESGDPGLRSAVVATLARIDPERALPFLLADLKRDDAGSRLRAAEIIAVSKGPAGPTVEALAAILATNRGPADYAPRVSALAALRELRKGAASAVPALIEALSDPNAWIRKGAAQALGAIGDPDARSAEPALRSALSDPLPDVRQAAQGALAALGIWHLGQLRIFSGDGVRVPLGQTALVKARLTDVEGRPRAGERVTFSTVRGAATLSSWSATTDAGGVATVTVIAGFEPGPIVVEARWETAAVSFHLSSVDR